MPGSGWLTATATGSGDSPLGEPLPSWPPASEPQQYAVSSVMAQELRHPALMPRTGASPGMSTRAGLVTLKGDTVVPMPNCPELLSPQQ